ncbi:hypothetical protein BC829DRAFT_416104 [Chytridium lagenaria]|nr:hypothetical protein BC829DRAFT_416104 [Chytridium lagenaria]
MGAFNLREPERHIEKLETYLMKSGIRADKEELVGTFKKGDAKILYLEIQRLCHRTWTPVDGWWTSTAKRKQRQRRLRGSRGKAERRDGKFQEESTEAWDRKEGSITEEEGVRIFVEGLRGRFRDNLETKIDLYDQRKDSWIATVGLIAEATTGKKIRKMDKGRGNLESSDSESEILSSDGTSESSELSDAGLYLIVQSRRQLKKFRRILI